MTPKRLKIRVVNHLVMPVLVACSCNMSSILKDISTKLIMKVNLKIEKKTALKSDNPEIGA